MCGAEAGVKRVTVKDPKTGKDIPVGIRNPVYLVHGINSGNETWGNGVGKCFLWELMSKERGLGS